MFDFKKLNVYSKAKSFCLDSKLILSLSNADKVTCDQFRRASFSIMLNIAEGMMGEKEQALDWLGNSVERGNFNYPFLNENDPFLENLREDTRFKKIIKRVKTEWESLV
jgi:hypothetical protein